MTFVLASLASLLAIANSWLIWRARRPRVRLGLSVQPHPAGGFTLAGGMPTPWEMLQLDITNTSQGAVRLGGIRMRMDTGAQEPCVFWDDVQEERVRKQPIDAGATAFMVCDDNDESRLANVRAIVAYVHGGPPALLSARAIRRALRELQQVRASGRYRGD
ncbi:MAG TPA: hypothetical protein VFN09_06670 [Rhodanobacteraceae bacterium]|nr:hypothetical protein [Rhodanobacteraceae bacterium]